MLPESSSKSIVRVAVSFAVVEVEEVEEFEEVEEVDEVDETDEIDEIEEGAAAVVVVVSFLGPDACVVAVREVLLVVLSRSSGVKKLPKSLASINATCASNVHPRHANSVAERPSDKFTNLSFTISPINLILWLK